MGVNIVGHSYLTYGARWVMSLTGALQPAKTNINYCHQFLNSQAVEILRNDGYGNYANILEYFTRDLNKGVNWADIGWKNITHYFDPVSGKGILKFANAVDETVLYFNKASGYWREKEYSKSIFCLGVAVHIVQDMCVPHHATNTVSPGHRRYEQWVRKRYRDYSVSCGGEYGRYDNPAEFAFQNALAASSYLDRVKLHRKSKYYHEVTKVVAPMAQRSTAELFHFFFNNLEI